MVPDHVRVPIGDLSWIPSSASRVLHFAEEERLTQERADFLDSVPVMSATVLSLEILLHERYIDLRKVSDLVLSDVGATIQILRLIGKEYLLSADRPSRMDDCIASLDTGSWFDIMCTRTFACDREHSSMTAVWKHCRLVAQYAQLVAESIEGIAPEDAYLVGLLHEIGKIPAVLGWPNDRSGGSAQGASFAMEDSLPLFVLAAIRSANDCCPSSTWKLILTAAHELAGARADCEPQTVYDFDSADINSRGMDSCLPSRIVSPSLRDGLGRGHPD